MFKLEDDVPITPWKAAPKYGHEWPLAEMQIGQSFAIPVEDYKNEARLVRCALARRVNAKALRHIKIITRIKQEPTEDGTMQWVLRVWRIA